MDIGSSPVALLYASVARHSSLPAFKIPVLDATSQSVERWRTVTYSEFFNDVQSSARHWRRTFESDGIPTRSAIGIWVAGFSYMDFVNIYALSAAGYVPQLFSIRLPNAEIIYELLLKAGARALIHGPTFDDILGECPVPRHVAGSSLPSSYLDEGAEPLPLPTFQPDDTLFIYHTSGSTSGSPKLVPCSLTWFDSAARKSRQISRPRSEDRQDVTVVMGSLCHIAQSFMYLGTIQYGSCLILPHRLDYTDAELVDMITRCSLNRLNRFPTFLASTFRRARTDSKLLSLLSDLDEIAYGGAALPREEEEWSFNAGLRITNLLGSTECGLMLWSGPQSGSKPCRLGPLDGFTYLFQPVTPLSSAVHQSTARLMELIIPANSPDCPHVSLRNAEDGDFHTGDLFQEVLPGRYVYRGRDDDWIKSENSLRCDTKAIEDNAMGMCANVIASCIVVGSGRPSPAMFVELAIEDTDPDQLKKEIIRKTRQFHSRRYIHERITSPDLIVVVKAGELPRTAKGNIRRKAVEEKYRAELDEIYQRMRR